MIKDPNAVLDYSWDWAAPVSPSNPKGPWLATGETITTATVIAPADLTIDDQTHDGMSVTAWISGGTAGQLHRVVCRVVTSEARTDERSITLVIEDR